jgi:hypothetical protein
LNANEKVRLENKLASKIRGHQFSLSTAVAQPTLTIRMITDTALRITRSIRLLRQGNLPQAVYALGVKPRGSHKKSVYLPQSSYDVSGLWLEMQYGWRPLLSDVHDGAQALASVLERRVFSGVKASTHKQSNVSYNNGGYTYGMYRECVRTIRCRYIELGTIPSLGLADPASLAWEVLPFSFIADWFVPIGTYLDNRNILGHTIGQFLITDFTRDTFWGASLNQDLYPDSDIVDGVRVSVNRIMTWNLTPTKPELQVPKASTAHFWNSLALLRQVIE